MKILTVDIGTGTQDIFLYDSNLDIENGFKLVLPSPTMMVHRRLKQALHLRTPILLTGHQMGGGPSAWAIEEYARAGIPVYMTPSAATTLNDELDKVEALGIKIVSEDEVERLTLNVQRIDLKDFDFKLISETFANFGVSLDDLAAISVAVFDHGNAPAGVSDRQFRFDYLDERIKEKNSLSAFAYLSTDIPKIMTRLQSVADSAHNLPCPLVVMDTAPAAVLGANFDSTVMKRERKIIVNVGNFHTLAFRLGDGIEGVFEHHTGEIDVPKLENYIRALADGSLKHQDIFDDMGHGALVYGTSPFEFGEDEFDVVVTGPRRSMFTLESDSLLSDVKQRAASLQRLKPYFAVPFGDMMIAGCFGLLAATADVMPELADTIYGSLRSGRGRGVAPWDNP
ncbi:MAG: pyruvate formate lyase-activating protein [Chloroflexi bacterium]|nr:pyruvate formate lyase-activating protein [Chloroflexota bacterium]